ncbi:MAG: AAA family ATPase [Patescibacteria group bacterium]
MDSQVVDVVRKIAMKTFNYDYIFYIRPEFPIEDDGIRSTNPDFQKAIQDYYEKFLIDNNIKYTLLTGSVDDRFNTVLKVINN